MDKGLSKTPMGNLSPDSRGADSLVALAILASLAFAASVSAAPGPKRALIFHKQNGYIHVDTDSGAQVMKRDWESRGVEVETSLDPGDFTAANLSRFGVVAFINTNYRNGHMLSRSQEAAIEGFVQQGRGFVCIHSAVPLNGTVEETVWPWYFRMIGARFDSHPDAKTASVLYTDRGHPASEGMPERFDLWDEWYRTQQNPGNIEGVRVLAKVDESRVPGGDASLDQPIVWVRNFEGGNVFVTLAGHDLRAYRNANYLNHLWIGVQWAGAWDSASTALGEASRPPAGGRPGLRAGSYPGVWTGSAAGKAVETEGAPVWRNLLGRRRP